MLILQFTKQKTRKSRIQRVLRIYASNETDSNEWKGTKIKYGYVPKSRTRCFNGFYLGFQESNQSRTRASFYEGLLSMHCSHEHLTQNTILLDDQDRTSISNVRSQKKSSLYITHFIHAFCVLSAMNFLQSLSYYQTIFIVLPWQDTQIQNC